MTRVYLNNLERQSNSLRNKVRGLKGENAVLRKELKEAHLAIAHEQDKAAELLMTKAKLRLQREFDAEPQWLLSVHMDTDDDAEVYYHDRLYCFYADDINISRLFNSKKEAIQHLQQELRVVVGGKADQFTADWLREAIKQLSKGEEVEDVYSNQTYTASLHRMGG